MAKIIDDALSIIKEFYTEAELEDFSIVDSGFGSLVIESKEGIIFRIAKNLDTAKQYVMECKVLPGLMKYLDTNIPNPIWHVFNTTAAPYGIMAYKKLKGNPIDATIFNKLNQENKNLIAKEVASFIVSIHKLPYEKLGFEDVPKIKFDKKALAILREDTSGFLKSKLTAGEYRKMEDWWEEILSDDNLLHYKPTLCHGDTWHENILVDDDYMHVVGVIDFSNMRIGDPAADLAPHIYLGKEFYNAVLHEYTKVFDSDRTIHQRIKRHIELREISGLQYVLKNNLIDEYEDTISKIRHRIILSSDF